MKVVHVSDCFLPRLGGIEVQVAELSRIQAAHGHDVAVITATPDHPRPGHADTPEHAGAPGHTGTHRYTGRQGLAGTHRHTGAQGPANTHDPLDAHGSGEGPGPTSGAPYAIHRLTAPLPWELPVDPHAGRRVGVLLARLEPDAVHVHVGAVSPFGWAAARRARADGRPTTVTVHSMWDPVTLAGYRALDRLTGWTGWGLVITTVSAAAATPIRRALGGRTPVHVVANGIDVAQWRLPAPARDGPGEGRTADRLRVAAVGRLAPRKRPVALLRLLREATDRLPTGVELHATIVGEGPGRPAMERYLRRHRMDAYVELTGRLDRPQVREVLSHSDIFLAPAPRESFGLAALEARTAGLPVVALTCSGVADFVRPGREGLLGRTQADLAEAIARLAADPALRREIATHNRRTTPDGCTWPEVLNAFEERYAEAAQSAQTPRKIT
ncbi:MAG: glycosyltransferase [Streptosporangiales bacterium]|nr:glycosyltransferase [Streptosporangiales bacterium]